MGDIRKLDGVGGWYRPGVSHSRREGQKKLYEDMVSLKNVLMNGMEDTGRLDGVRVMVSSRNEA